MPTDNVIRMDHYQNTQDMLAFIDIVRQKIVKGEIQGLLVGIRLDDWDHGVAVLGRYRDDPIGARAAAGALFDVLSTPARDKITPADLV